MIHTKKLQGFTLIELMVVIAILAILVAFAIPSYQNYLEKTNLAQAKQVVTNIQSALAAEKLANPRQFETVDDYNTFLNEQLARIPAEVRQQYNFSANAVETKKNSGAISLVIQANPRNSSYKSSLWSSNSNFFKCPKSDSPTGKPTSSTPPQKCESF